jgi:hypothetical protein
LFEKMQTLFLVLKYYHNDRTRASELSGRCRPTPPRCCRASLVARSLTSRSPLPSRAAPTCHVPLPPVMRTARSAEPKPLVVVVLARADGVGGARSAHRVRRPLPHVVRPARLAEPSPVLVVGLVRHHWCWCW